MKPFLPFGDLDLRGPQQLGRAREESAGLGLAD